MSKLSSKKLAKLLQPVRMLLMDVDGVLTDGHLLNVPSPSGEWVETKSFDSQDGLALRWLHEAGIQTGVISGRQSPAVEIRAKQVGLSYVYQGHLEKIPILEEIMRESSIPAGQIAYVGDDLTDIVIMRRVGVGIAVANARPEARKAAHHTTENAGGSGAVREIAEAILKAQGHWSGILDKYEAKYEAAK